MSSCLWACRARVPHLLSVSPAVISSEGQRSLTLSPICAGKRNPRKFFLGNKRGSKVFRRQQAEGKYEYAPLWKPVQDVGFLYQDQFHLVPEMIPELVVPDLTDCQLKPYVSYRTADIYQTEFTARDLFEVVYRPKITKDFSENKLDAQGNPVEPSPEEQLTPEEAWTRARKSGSDIFSERIPRQWECLEKSLIDELEATIKISSDDLEQPTERRKKLEAEEPQEQRQRSAKLN